MQSASKKSEGKKLDPLGLRFDEDMNKRLVKCAQKLGQTKTSLGQQAVIALVEAIEKANYRMVIPLEISVSYVPTPAGRNPTDLARLKKFLAEQPDDAAGDEQPHELPPDGADAGY